MKTEVDAKGKYAAAQARPHNYRTKYRFEIYPGKPFFTSRFLWLENTDPEPWELGAYFHYLPSGINGSASDDEAKGKYWFDAGANVAFGIESFSPVMKINFWKDPGGGEHPDALREVNRFLKPGERYDEPQPEVYVIAVEGQDEKAWRQAVEDIRALSGVVTRAFAAEKY